MKEKIKHQRREALDRLFAARILAREASRAYIDDPTEENFNRCAKFRRGVKEAEAEFAEWTAETEGTI